MPNTHSTLSSLFTDIANAIRNKTGGTAQIVADDFPTEIANIPSGGIDPSDATATASDILATKTAYISTGKTTGTMVNNGAVSQTLDTTTTSYAVPSGYHNGNGSVSIITQTKSVSPSTSSQTVSADSGKVLSSVSVGAIATQSKSCTPSGSAQTITPDSGKYLSQVSVDAVTKNSGIGQTLYNQGVSDTKVGTATASDVLSGKTFTNATTVGASGGMTNRGAWTASVTPSSSAQTVTIPQGYHNGNGYVDIGASGGISVTVPTTYSTTSLGSITLNNSAFTSLTNYVENGRFYWLKSAALNYDEIACQGGVIAFGYDGSSGFATPYLPYIIPNTGVNSPIAPPTDRSVLIFVFDKSTAKMKSYRSATCTLYPMN